MSIGRSEGTTKLLFDESTHEVIGSGIVGPHAGGLIAEAALAIEMGADATDLGQTIHPHPTLSETVNLPLKCTKVRSRILSLPRSVDEEE